MATQGIGTTRQWTLFNEAKLKILLLMIITVFYDFFLLSILLQQLTFEGSQPAAVQKSIPLPLLQYLTSSV